MSKPVLHYFCDPLCGWCYAAEPLVEAAAAAGIPVMLHGGGLWDAPTRPPDGMRQHIKSADGRIGQITGQVFGPAYLDGLLLDPDLTFHSRPTIAAILAAETMEPGQGLSMMRAIQKAHYVDGSKVVETETLTSIAGGMGLEATKFRAAFDSVLVDDHIHETRVAMQRHGLQGFPAFVLEQEGVSRPVPHERYYGQPAAFVAEALARAKASPNLS